MKNTHNLFTKLLGSSLQRKSYHHTQVFWVHRLYAHHTIAYKFIVSTHIILLGSLLFAHHFITHHTILLDSLLYLWVKRPDQRDGIHGGYIAISLHALPTVTSRERGILGQPKLKVPSSGQNFISGRGRREATQEKGIVGNEPKILETKFWKTNLLLHHR